MVRANRVLSLVGILKETNQCKWSDRDLDAAVRKV